ncbi:MAG: endonuclease III [Verrucomicrobia bacterium]|nr:endonuclease III [Verrucomicrobiota bacterium]
MKLPSKEHCAELARRLARVYPDARCELQFSSPLQLLVAVILSAQCTDKRVNMITPGLFQKYPDAAHFAGTSQEELEAAIRSTGFFRNKARNIRLCCQALVSRFGGKVPERMEDLLTLDGVGRKTANVVLNAAFGKNEGVCVDTHVLRLAGRLGLSRETSPEGVERDLMRLFPRAQWGNLTSGLIWHGRRRCHARRPDCQNCEIQAICPFPKKNALFAKKQLSDASGFGRGDISRPRAADVRSRRSAKNP